MHQEEHYASILTSNECTYLEECVYSRDVRLTVFDGEMAKMEVRELGHHKVNLDETLNRHHTERGREGEREREREGERGIIQTLSGVVAVLYRLVYVSLYISGQPHTHCRPYYAFMPNSLCR